MRDDSRCSTHSSLRLSGGGCSSTLGRSGVASGSGGSVDRCAVICSTASTSNTSDASRRKIPLIPVCDAIASMRAAMLSNVGPAVSERTYLRSSE